MLAWARRAADLASSPSAPEEDRLAAGLFLVVIGAAAVAGAAWAVAYAALGRPISAAIPGGFALIAVGVFVALVRRRRLGRLREFTLVLFIVLPTLLQASLGGYVKGSAVVMWAFVAPLGALIFFGVRAAIPWLVAFLMVAIATAVLETWLSRLTPALPAAVQTVFFAFNLSGVAALVTLVLASFRVQRDRAMERSESLLLNVLPSEIAVRLKRKEYPVADRFEDVSVLFGDLVGFTMRSATESPEETVAVLNEFLSTFDVLAARHGLRPIRTLGDSYLVVAGVPVPRTDHCEAIADMALDMLDEVERLNGMNSWNISFRIGINAGPAIAAVVGRNRFTYDVWSDAVNTASRMESSGLPGRIQVTESIYLRLRNKYNFEPRGEIDVKGKGLMKTYFLVGRTNTAGSPAPKVSS